MDTKNDKETLDRLGRELFRQRRGSEKLVTQALSNPDLFAGVLKRVSEEPKAVRVAGFRLYAATLTSVAVLTIVTIGAISLLRSSNRELAVDAIAVQDPAQQSVPATARPNLPPPSDGFEDDLETLPGRAAHRPARAERPVVQNASYTTTDRPSRPQRPAASRDEFYAIGYGDTSDANGGRIVRVDIPRSSLFAMGINVPLENDSETVKADLLIGPDGVTRGVRVVK